MKELARQVWLIYRNAEERGVQALVRPSIPILFFGDYERYFASPLRIITVGLNPSRVEFPESDRFARFPAARGIDPSSPTLDLYLRSLRDYFRERPYDAWFKPAFGELLRGMSASYYDGAESTALHTDICTPLATDPTWSRLKEQHAALAVDGGELWHNLVERLEPDVILISVARQYLDKIRFRKLGAWTTVHTVERTNPFSVQAVAIEVTSAKETLLVFGRAANLPFGTVSGANARSAKRSGGRSMREKREFVQFIHPGGEHRPDDSGHNGWNVGPHKRKFLTAPGRYIDDGRTQVGDLAFWGEWEAQSRIVKEYSGQVSDGPHFLHQPYYDPPTTWAGNWRQNTDPFVFGDQFHYTGCLQHTKRGPTQLRFLDRGSILLFGSCRERSRFVVDTVFVVDRWIDHGVTDFAEKLLKGAVSNTYATVTIGPWYSTHMPKDRSHRLYFGASQDRAVDGMYSFFPCLPAQAALEGFPRPTIRLPGQITQQLTQGKKMTAIGNPDQARALWAEVAGQIQSQGLNLGVHAELPPRRQESMHTKSLTS